LSAETVGWSPHYWRANSGAESFLRTAKGAATTFLPQLLSDKTPQPQADDLSKIVIVLILGRFSRKIGQPY
jgi:hypothetical protein